MQPESAKEGMIKNFEGRVEPKGQFERLSAERLGEIMSTEQEQAEFDGVAFCSAKILIFVQYAGLPEEFFVSIMKLGEGEVDSFETHDSTKCARRVNDYMTTHPRNTF